MKKILIATGILLSLNIFAINFESMQGCYKSISMNGNTPSNGPIQWRNQTTFEKHISSTYRDISTTNYIDLYILDLFQGYNEPYYGYSPIVLLKDKATKYIEEENYMFYEVDTDLFMKSYGTYSKVDHFVSLEIVKNENLYSGVAYFKSKIRNFDRRIDFKILKEECSEDHI